jgi:hypothetical protein
MVLIDFGVRAYRVPMRKQDCGESGDLLPQDEGRQARILRWFNVLAFQLGHGVSGSSGKA